MANPVGKVKLAPVMPTYCSSCFNQDNKQRHVDFGAYWDGPVLEGSVRVAIDDLVLCESCLKEGAALLGLKDPGFEAQRAENMERELEEANARLAGLQDYVSKLEDSVASKPIPKGARKRQAVPA